LGRNNNIHIPITKLHDSANSGKYSTMDVPGAFVKQWICFKPRKTGSLTVFAETGHDIKTIRFSIRKNTSARIDKYILCKLVSKNHP
jgi:hypothetical protein